MEASLDTLILETVKHHIEEFSQRPEMMLHPQLTLLGNYVRGIFSAQDIAGDIKGDVEEYLQGFVDAHQHFRQATRYREVNRRNAWPNYLAGAVFTFLVPVALVQWESLPFAALSAGLAYYCYKGIEEEFAALQHPEPSPPPQGPAYSSLPQDLLLWAQAVEAAKPELEKAIGVYEQLRQEKCQR